MPNKGLTWKAVSCGCEIDSAGMGIVWCPLHAAAEEMRETVQWLVDVIEGFYGREDAAGKGERVAVRKARALLAKVEGR